MALDAHTGAAISQSAVRSSDQQTIYGPPVFDPVNYLVYVGTKHMEIASTTRPANCWALECARFEQSGVVVYRPGQH